MIKEYNSDNRFNKDFKKMWLQMIENNGELPMPDSFDFVPTLRCNLNCPGCFQKKNRFKYKEELTFEETKLILDKLDLDDKIFKLIGGEIFVSSENTYSLIEYLTSRNANIIIGTNALEPLIEHPILNSNIVEMTTSLDGLAHTHDKLRGTQGSFKAARDFIYNYGKLGYGYKINVTSMLYKENLEQVKDLIKLKEQLGINVLRFQIPKWSTDEEIEESKSILGPDSILDVSRYPYGYSGYSLYKNIKDIQNISDIHIQPNYYFKDPETTYEKKIRSKHKCMCIYLFRAKINPDGEVNPCFYILNKIGNLKDKSLEEIWNSEEYKKLRMDLANNNLAPICENCCSMRIIE